MHLNIPVEVDLMNCLISIIIPVYNLEGYIENCLNSILAQTFTDFEVICIDDGSTDRSAEIIKRYCESDSRIKYYYQDNSGVSSARNNGLDKVNGNYVMFVDGDDYLHYQAVEVFVDEIVSSGCDIVCSNELYTTDMNEKMSSVSNPVAGNMSIEEMFDYKNNRCPGKSVWGKIFKAEVAKRSSFPVGISNGEDGYYIIMLLDSGVSVRHIDTVLYYYLNRENSAVTSAFTVNKFSITKSFDILCEKLKDSSNSFLKKYCLQYLFQTIFYNRTRAIGTDCEKYVIENSKSIGKKWMKSFLNNKDISLYVKILFVVFFNSRHIYELARGIQDPTMFDFYKNRRKGKNSDGAETQK